MTGKKLVFLTIVDENPARLTELAQILNELKVTSDYEFVLSNTKIESINRDELIRVIHDTKRDKDKME